MMISDKRSIFISIGTKPKIILHVAYNNASIEISDFLRLAHTRSWPYIHLCSTWGYSVYNNMLTTNKYYYTFFRLVLRYGYYDINIFIKIIIRQINHLSFPYKIIQSNPLNGPQVRCILLCLFINIYLCSSSSLHAS